MKNITLALVLFIWFSAPSLAETIAEKYVAHMVEVSKIIESNESLLETEKEKAYLVIISKIEAAEELNAHYKKAFANIAVYVAEQDARILELEKELEFYK